MILLGIGIFLEMLNGILINLDTLMIDTYISLRDIWAVTMILTIIFWIIRGLIRHNGNS